MPANEGCKLHFVRVVYDQSLEAVSAISVARLALGEQVVRLLLGDSFNFNRRSVMVFNQVFQKFIEQSPVSVMFRGTLENVFAAERLDRIFHDAARRQ